MSVPDMLMDACALGSATLSEDKTVEMPTAAILARLYISQAQA